MPCRSPRSAVKSSSVRELGPPPVWHGPVTSAPNTPKPTVGLTGPSHLVGGVSSWQRSRCSCCDRASWAILTRQILSRGIVLGALLGIGFVLCTIGMQTTSVLISAFVTGTTVVFRRRSAPPARRVDEDCGQVLEALPLRSIAGIGHGGFVRHDKPWSSRAVGAVDRVFDELVGRWQSVHRRYGQRRFSSDHQAELLGRIVRVHL
jgi:hypothetical protein